MKKCAFWKAFLLCLAVFLYPVQDQAGAFHVVNDALAAPSDNQAQERQLKLMSTFLSNFTEVRLFDFDVKKSGDGSILHLGADPSNPFLIRFGVWHNYVNNYKTRVKPCPVKGCKHGPLVIEARYVAESVRKFFDLDVKHRTVDEYDPPSYFDGKYYHFDGADGDAPYFAKVTKARQEGGVVYMSGYVYNGDDESDRPYTFEATAKPHTWNGVKTWAILSFMVRER
ncbi:MAG: hypothetical protein IKX79_00395 [Desulfovibrionaceae bacterium]|nr:hypothetical protein [Desulfovibrionaceae bacterium]